MVCYKEEYGADADGNRGVMQWECEIDEGDREEIREQLLDSWVTITLINPYTEEEEEFEVSVRDYLYSE